MRNKKKRDSECDKYNNVEDTYYHITLFQSDFDEPYRLKSLVGDSMNCGVLDCGSSETVWGKIRCGSSVIWIL